MRESTKKGFLLIGGIVGLLLAAAVLVGVFQFHRMDNTLQQITQPGESYRELGVYVLKDDPAAQLEDTVGYAYAGVQRQGLEQLELALGQSPAWEEYPTVFALADALRQGECQAVLLEDAYQQSMRDARGYEWTQEEMRKVGSVRLPGEEEGLPLSQGGIEESFLLYLSGNDVFGDISTLSRSDVNILAAVNTRTKQLFLLSTPRDYYVSFAETGEKKDKLAHAGIYGIEASIDALETLYDVEIPYYVRMNFTGFVQVIDALGGVSVYSDREFTVEGIRTYEKGYNQLTGIEALAFARERMSFAEGDYKRAENQMEVVRSLVEKAASGAVLENLSPVLDAVEGNFETNLSREQILSLAPSLGGDWEISTLTAKGESSYAQTYSMPGAQLYVILPDPDSVEQAGETLRKVLAGEE